MEKFDRMDKTFFRYMTQIPSILGQFSVGVCVCVCVCVGARARVCVCGEWMPNPAVCYIVFFHIFEQLK